MYYGVGIALIVIGAILSFAIENDVVSGVNLAVIGYILMAGGVLAIVITIIATNRSQTTVVRRNPPPPPGY